jgi:hypothetical protein
VTSSSGHDLIHARSGSPPVTDGPVAVRVPG